MKLNIKAAGVIAVSVLFTIILSSVLFNVAGALFFRGYNHVKLEQVSAELAAKLERVDLADGERLVSIMEAFAERHGRIGIDLVAADGTLLYSSAGRDASYTLPELLERLSAPFQRLFFSGDVVMAFEMMAAGKPVFAVFEVGGDAIQQAQVFLYFTNWAIIPFLIMPILLIIALPSFFAFLFIVWVTRRLNRLNQAMRSLDLSGEPVFLHDGSKDEIGALTSLYNEMAGKLHDQYRRIRQIEQARSNLVSQLSHDLRTPLSVIKGYAETLQRGSAHDRETRLRHATIILQKSDYMNELLRKLFRLAQLDDPAQAFEKKEGHLDSLLQTIMADYVLILQDKGIAWQMEMPESPVAMTFNRDGLTQLFRNLIDNAILHGGDGKYLGIRLKREGPSVHIEIEDRGKGIPDHQLNRVFDPFYRINQGRPGNGLGIGLTLAAAIARQHGGAIEQWRYGRIERCGNRERKRHLLCGRSRRHCRWGEHPVLPFRRACGRH